MFSPPSEYALLGKATEESLVVYPKGDSLGEFLEIRPDATAFLKFIFEPPSTFTMEEASGIMDDYASGGEQRGPLGVDHVVYR